MASSLSLKTNPCSSTLTLTSFPIHNIMNNLLLLRKIHDHNLVTLSDIDLQELESYQKMLKFILANVLQRPSSKGEMEKKSAKNNLTKFPTKPLQIREKSSKAKTIGTIQKNDDKKLCQFDTHQLYKGLYETIRTFFKKHIMEFRLKNTDIVALFTKYKYSDQFLNHRSFSIIEEIVEKYQKKMKEQPEPVINSPHLYMAEDKNKLLYYSLGDLVDRAVKILEDQPFHLKIVKETNKTAEQLNISGIIHTICEEYNIVPYHNFTHGFAVFLSYFDMSHVKGISKYFDDFSLFFSLIACISHDIGHPGNNTLFEVKVKSEISVLFSNISVMEKMHVAKTMEILSRNPKTNTLFENLTPPQQIKARKIIANCILATDMMKHYSYVEKLETLMKDKVVSEDEEISPQSKELVMQVLIHSCDIENPSFQYNNYLQWANLICLQFHMQATKENLLNVQVTTFMKFDSLPYFYRNQISFSSTIVLPLWELLEEKFSTLKERKISYNIRKNLEILTSAIRRNSEQIGSQTLNRIGTKGDKIEQFVGGRLQDFLTSQKIKEGQIKK